MTIYSLTQHVGGQSQEDRRQRAARYIAMVAGLDIDPVRLDYRSSVESQIEISTEDTKKILALDFSERATNDMRAMGEGIGRLNVNVPSNINVWSHTKGASVLTEAAHRLTDAVAALAKS